MNNERSKHKRNRLARIIKPIERASGVIFNTLTNDHVPEHKFMAERPKSDGDYRDDMAKALKDWRPYPDGARYHVTLKPTFNARDSILTSGSDEHAFTYAEYKLNAMANTGALRDGDAIYVWDMGAPSGTLSPIAKFTMVNGEVERV